MATEYSNIDPANPPKAQTKHIWKTFFILVGITAVEFVFAFFFPEGMKNVLITIYVFLTLFKAYFIVSEFMHLGHEVKSLMLAIILPMMFVLWMVLAFLLDAVSYYEHNYDFENTVIEQETTKTPAE